MCSRRWLFCSCRLAISTTSCCEGRSCPLNEISGKFKLVVRPWKLAVAVEALYWNPFLQTMRGLLVGFGCSLTYSGGCASLVAPGKGCAARWADGTQECLSRMNTDQGRLTTTNTDL